MIDRNDVSEGIISFHILEEEIFFTDIRNCEQTTLYSSVGLPFMCPISDLRMTSYWHYLHIQHNIFFYTVL